MKPFLPCRRFTARRFPFTGILAGLACALVPDALIAGNGLSEGDTPRYQRPAFVHAEAGDINPTRVIEIQSTEVTDLVLLAAGYQAGYRPGMVCRVTREGEMVAEILMVEVRDQVSAAIIVGILSEKIIEPGDAVRVKTVQH